MNIIEVVPKDNFILYIKSDDEREGLFDVKPYLDSEVFGSLINEGEFKKIFNGGYFIEWDCGADVSADTIEARWENISEKVIGIPTNSPSL